MARPSHFFVLPTLGKERVQATSAVDPSYRSTLRENLRKMREVEQFVELLKDTPKVRAISPKTNGLHEGCVDPATGAPCGSNRTPTGAAGCDGCCVIS